MSVVVELKIYLQIQYFTAKKKRHITWTGSEEEEEQEEEEQEEDPIRKSFDIPSDQK